MVVGRGEGEVWEGSRVLKGQQQQAVCHNGRTPLFFYSGRNRRDDQRSAGSSMRVPDGILLAVCVQSLSLSGGEASALCLACP